MSVNNTPAEPVSEVALWETNQCVGGTDTYPGTAERTGGQTGGRSADRPRSITHTKYDQYPETAAETTTSLHNNSNNNNNTQTHTTVQKPETSLCSCFGKPVQL